MACSGPLAPYFVNNAYVTAEIICNTAHAQHKALAWSWATLCCRDKWAPPQMWRFPGGSDSKESVCSVGDPGLIPGSGRSLGEGNDNPLQYSCLENPMDSGALWATVHGVPKSWTWLSDQHFISLEHGGITAASRLCLLFGSATSGENLACLLLWLQHQPGDNKCVCSSFGSLSLLPAS